jgi:hypothetical protein
LTLRRLKKHMDKSARGYYKPIIEETESIKGGDSMKSIGINLNRYVYFTLTEHGESIVEQRRKELNKQFSNIEVPKSSLVKQSSDGLSYMMLWEFMELFGKHLYNGAKLPVVDCNIYFKEEEN